MTTNLTTLAIWGTWIHWWQIPLVIILVVIIVLWKRYRANQM